MPNLAALAPPDPPATRNPAPELIAGIRSRMAARGQLAADKAARPRRAPVKRFSTQRAIDWGRGQLGEDGRPWQLIDRERYDARLKRHHDLEGAVDAMFDDQRGRVGVQGAGRGERAAHWARFLEWGCPEASTLTPEDAAARAIAKARRRGLSIVYVEFERHNPAPLLVEWWVRCAEGAVGSEAAL